MMRWFTTGLMIAGLLAGCGKNEPAAGPGGSDELKPREIGEFTDANGSTTRPAGTEADAAGAQDPMAAMPNDDTHAQFRMNDIVPSFPTPPAEWKQQPARAMTDQVFALPRAEGDPEDADLAISSLGRHIPMDSNVTRWCGMFGYQGEACKENAKIEKLEGTKFPTTVVDISGTYQGSSMMAPAGPPKENFRMIVAELRTPQKPYYVRLTGPQKSVEKWHDAFMTFVREAK